MIFLPILYMCVLGACKEEKLRTMLELFSESQPLSEKRDWHINDDSLGVASGLVCDGKNLIVYDVHSGTNYTLFDEGTGKYIARFGTIGQGPTELSSECYRYHLSRGSFFVCDNQVRAILKFNPDALRNGKANADPICLARYKIPEASISTLIAMDDSTYVCAGLYQPRYQFWLFDKNNKVLDHAVDVYNATDSSFNVHTKALANQGEMVMHPQKKMFAYATRLSSNIDFFEVVDHKIKLIKSLHLGDPILKSEVEGDDTMFSASPTEDTQIGFFSLCATDKYVYALYTENKVYESSIKSNTVLVFDWEGNPVKKYILDKKAAAIAVDEARQNLFATVLNKEDGWSIICYVL